jgi:hypothetical protein
MNNVLERILNAAAEAYPDPMLIEQYVIDPGGDHGDGLAKFIVAEIGDVFLGVEYPNEAIDEVYRALSRAADELRDVAEAVGSLDAEEAA